MPQRSPRTSRARSQRSPYHSPKLEDDDHRFKSPPRSGRSSDDDDEDGSEEEEDSLRSTRGDYSKSDISFNNSVFSDLSSRSSASPGMYPNLHCQKESPGSSSSADRTRKRELYPDLKTSQFQFESAGESYERKERPSSQTKSQESSNPIKNEANENNFGAIIVCFVILLAIVAFFLAGSPTESVNEGVIPPFQYFTGRVDEFKKDFPKQNRRLWNTFKASAKHILNSTDPTYPSVILMASDVKNAQLAACIAKKMTSSFESSQGMVPSNAVTNIEAIMNVNENAQKKKLDDHLVSALQDKGSKAFVVENLQLLSPEASLLLFKYCDGDNAPFKDIMLVLSLTVHPSELELDPDKPSSVEKYLSALWLRGLHEDKVGALMSRVANNIVVVSQEESGKWEKVCT